MKKTPFKCLMLLTLVFLFSCKKSEKPETDDSKFQKAMLAAGFKIVSDKDIPHNISPYQLSDQEILDISNGVKKEVLPSLKTKKMQANLGNSNALIDIDPSLYPKADVVISGLAQYYFFNNCNVFVIVGFNNVSDSWKNVFYDVKVSSAQGNGNYFSMGGVSRVNYDDKENCEFKSTGTFYFRAQDRTYSAQKHVNAFSSQGRGLDVIVQDN